MRMCMMPYAGLVSPSRMFSYITPSGPWIGSRSTSNLTRMNMNNAKLYFLLSFAWKSVCNAFWSALLHIYPPTPPPWGEITRSCLCERACEPMWTSGLCLFFYFMRLDLNRFQTYACQTLSPSCIYCCLWFEEVSSVGVCSSLGTIWTRPPTCTCEMAGMKILNLHVWGHGSLLEKSGMLSSDEGKDLAPGREVQVSWSDRVSGSSVTVALLVCGPEAGEQFQAVRSLIGWWAWESGRASE